MTMSDGFNKLFVLAECVLPDFCLLLSELWVGLSLLRKIIREWHRSASQLMRHTVELLQYWRL